LQSINRPLKGMQASISAVVGFEEFIFYVI